MLRLTKVKSVSVVYRNKIKKKKIFFVELMLRHAIECGFIGETYLFSSYFFSTAPFCGRPVSVIDPKCSTHINDIHLYGALRSLVHCSVRESGRRAVHTSSNVN